MDQFATRLDKTFKKFLKKHSSATSTLIQGGTESTLTLGGTEERREQQKEVLEEEEEEETAVRESLEDTGHESSKNED